MGQWQNNSPSRQSRGASRTRTPPSLGRGLFVQALVWSSAEIAARHKPDDYQCAGALLSVSAALNTTLKRKIHEDGRTTWSSTREISLVAALVSAMLFSSLPMPVLPQDIHLVVADVREITDGYRESKLIRSSIFNDENEKIGTIEDITNWKGQSSLHSPRRQIEAIAATDHLPTAPTPRRDPTLSDRRRIDRSNSRMTSSIWLLPIPAFSDCLYCH
jgi:hypothetical protein